ncbi:hypothetical protein L6164_016610 [Bauhinia variegata]|uniref:Uncharacterized protein n=1 Tax=Bauhinia variegata TaxID=167791 RepID=A0ACB9NQ94_BAUVA|nr:hypothetical protein L6164_016610 [Bauhinia variegata]
MRRQQIRPGRPDDECWQYVDKVDEKRWTCKYCLGCFGGSITRVKAHLAGIRGQQISICHGEVPSNVKLAASQGLCNTQPGDSTHVQPTRQAQASMKRNHERDNGTCQAAAFVGNNIFQPNEVLSFCNTSTDNWFESLLALDDDTSGLEMTSNPIIEARNRTIQDDVVEEQPQLRESPSRKKRRTEVMTKSIDQREFTRESTDLQAEHGTEGIEAGINTHIGKGNHNPNAPTADDGPQLDAFDNVGTNPPTNASRSDDEPQLNAYYNGGTQDIIGITNLSGHIKGNANGVINLGILFASAATSRDGNYTSTPTQPHSDTQQKVAAIGSLADILKVIDGTKIDSATSRPRITLGTQFDNTGRQNIKGLSNQTGYVEGNANGVINVGELYI